MTGEDRPGLGSEPPVGEDLRVQAVLDVLAGARVSEVARRRSVDAAVLDRWVRAFVDAGTAQITNRPVEDSARQRDRFLAAFAHETRTPLAVAQGWVQLLREGEVPPAQFDRTVARLDDALGWLAERARDVELLAAASLGLVQPQRVDVLAGELLASLEPRPEIRGSGPETVLHVDPDLFLRIVRDLWIQVKMARPEPDEMFVAIEQVGLWTEVRVVRRGEPVEPQVLRALFEPFDLNDDGTGVTIGLYLARALSVVHGGTVGVDQDESGAAFWVRVPAPRQAPAAVHPISEELG